MIVRGAGESDRWSDQVEHVGRDTHGEAMELPGTLALRLIMVALLVVGACGSDSPENSTEPPPCCRDLSGPSYPGVATLVTEHNQIPADGTTLTIARATFTDERGIARPGLSIEFVVDLADVTWIANGGSDLVSAKCLAFTGADGTAECTFRAGLTPGFTYIRASARPAFDLTAATQVQFLP